MVALSERLRVTDVTRRLGVSARALRLYDEQGLVRARRDDINHRWYDAQACAELEMVVVLRSADVPLIDIRKVLDALRSHGRDAGADVALTLVRSRLAELNAQAERLSEIVDGLSAGQLRSRSGAAERNELIKGRNVARWPSRP